MMIWTPFHDFARQIIPPSLYHCVGTDWEGRVALTAKATLSQLRELRGIAARVLADAEAGRVMLDGAIASDLRELLRSCDHALANPTPQSKLAVHALDPSPSARVH